jgi:hypothetical protein
MYLEALPESIDLFPAKKRTLILQHHFIAAIIDLVDRRPTSFSSQGRVVGGYDAGRAFSVAVSRLL